MQKKTKKLVVNRCYGGFSLSPLAIKKLAELKGKDCYFFELVVNGEGDDRYIPVSLEEATNNVFMVVAYSVPNPQGYELDKADKDGLYKEANKRAEKISLDSRPEKRDDPDLIKVVEELGVKANGSHAELEIVKIPDDVDWVIGEYDGMETVEEKHRSW